jgi:hypothetical protein
MCRDWQKKQPKGYSAPARRKWQYGISEEVFQSMIAAQNNCCAICLEVFDRTPCIDHDHITGEIRGLLCRFCNLVLGNAKDKVLVLQRAMDYLRKYDGKETP